MALQMATFLKGRVNNLVFYQRGGTHIARTVPDKVRQSPATKKRTSNFCIAATAGKLLRQQLGNNIPFAKDKKMQNRFGGAIAKWIGVQDIPTLSPQTVLPYLTGFSFNEASSIAERWKIAFTLSRLNEYQLQLFIPAFIPTQVFAAPAHTTSVECIVSAASCNLLQLSAGGSGSSVSIQIPFNTSPVAAQTILLNVDCNAGSLVICVITVRFITETGLDTRAAFTPADVIDARYC